MLGSSLLRQLGGQDVAESPVIAVGDREIDEAMALKPLSPLPLPLLSHLPSISMACSSFLCLYIRVLF